MGIPSYSKRLLRSKKIVCNKPESIDILLLDYNAMIHPSSHKVIARIKERYLQFPEKKRYTTAQVYNMIIIQCLKDLEYIYNFVSPSETCYVCIDGVAPFAKMHQQRLRRFHPDSINSESKQIFDSVCITPGTEFMEKLSLRLKKYCSGRPFIISDASEPGEGEHKIMDIIRREEQKSHCVFTLDADMIMLTLVPDNCEKIYILRQEQDDDLIKQFGEFNFIDTGILRKELISKAQEIVPDLNPKLIINDYLVFCFFGGNDFLGHVPGCQISCGSLDYLLNEYHKLLQTTGKGLTLESNGKIILDIDSFRNYIKMLKNNEDYQVAKNYKMLAKRNSECQDYYEPVDFNDKNWTSNYYQYFFKTLTSLEIKELSSDYVKTIEWIIGYYNGQATDYRYYYNNVSSPSFRDIYDILSNYKHYQFQSKTFCSPIEQLLCVIPPQSAGLLPRKYQRLMTDSDSELIMYYPIKCGISNAYCNATWQYKPLFPRVDFEEIITASKSIL